jgi:hypothetical protein
LFIVANITMVTRDISQQGVQGPLIACKVTSDTACSPFIAIFERFVQLVTVPGDVSTEPVDLFVIALDVAIILVKILALVGAV